MTKVEGDGGAGSARRDGGMMVAGSSGEAGSKPFSQGGVHFPKPTFKPLTTTRYYQTTRNPYP